MAWSVTGSLRPGGGPHLVGDADNMGFPDGSGDGCTRQKNHVVVAYHRLCQALTLESGWHEQSNSTIYL